MKNKIILFLFSFFTSTISLNAQTDLDKKLQKYCKDFYEAYTQKNYVAVSNLGISMKFPRQKFTKDELDIFYFMVLKAQIIKGEFFNYFPKYLEGVGRDKFSKADWYLVQSFEIINDFKRLNYKIKNMDEAINNILKGIENAKTLGGYDPEIFEAVKKHALTITEVQDYFAKIQLDNFIKNKDYVGAANFIESNLKGVDNDYKYYCQKIDLYLLQNKSKEALAFVQDNLKNPKTNPTMALDIVAYFYEKNKQYKESFYNYALSYQSYVRNEDKLREEYSHGNTITKTPKYTYQNCISGLLRVAYELDTTNNIEAQLKSTPNNAIEPIAEFNLELRQYYTAYVAYIIYEAHYLGKSQFPQLINRAIALYATNEKLFDILIKTDLEAAKVEIVRYAKSGSIHEEATLKYHKEVSEKILTRTNKFVLNDYYVTKEKRSKVFWKESTNYSNLNLLGSTPADATNLENRVVELRNVITKTTASWKQMTKNGTELTGSPSALMLQHMIGYNYDEAAAIYNKLASIFCNSGNPDKCSSAKALEEQFRGLAKSYLD